jgi:hypothetical protein
VVSSRGLILACALCLSLALAGCGGEGASGDAASQRTPEEVISAFSSEEIALVIARDRRGDDGAILVAVLDPEVAQLKGQVAVDLFRSEDDATAFVAQLKDKPEQWPKWIQRSNVVVFFQDEDDDLVHRIESAMNAL